VRRGASSIRARRAVGIDRGDLLGADQRGEGAERHLVADLAGELGGGPQPQDAFGVGDGERRVALDDDTAASDTHRRAADAPRIEELDGAW
jgi:hypothetical protein